MTRSTKTLDVLLDDVDDAYRALRVLVVDCCPPGTPLDGQGLSPTQWLAVDRYNRAERRLTDYRTAVHDSLS